MEEPVSSSYWGSDEQLRTFASLPPAAYNWLAEIREVTFRMAPLSCANVGAAFRV